VNPPFYPEYLRQISSKIGHSPAEQLFVWFMTADAALFLSFLAAFYINQAQDPSLISLAGLPVWPLHWTLFNFLFLGASLLFLLRAFLAIFGPQQRHKTSKWLGLSVWSGSIFTLLQSLEWLQLFLFGFHEPLTIMSTFFYLLIGGYALHLLAGLIALKAVQRNLALNNWMLQPFSHARIILGQTHLALVGACWSGLLLLWPVLYYLTYLS